jgi:hypothetical protein
MYKHLNEFKGNTNKQPDEKWKTGIWKRKSEKKNQI